MLCNPGPSLDYSSEFLASRGSTQKSSPSMMPSHPISPDLQLSPLQLSSGWDTPYIWHAFSTPLHPRLSLPSTRELSTLNWICVLLFFFFGPCTGSFFQDKKFHSSSHRSFQTQAPCLWWVSFLILRLLCFDYFSELPHAYQIQNHF